MVQCLPTNRIFDSAESKQEESSPSMASRDLSSVLGICPSSQDFRLTVHHTGPPHDVSPRKKERNSVHTERGVKSRLRPPRPSRSCRYVHTGQPSYEFANPIKSGPTTLGVSGVGRSSLCECVCVCVFGGPFRDCD